MKFKVSWKTTVRSEVEVEATSKEEAAKLVEEGQFEKEEVEEDHDFQGITSVKIAELNVGATVTVREHGSAFGKGLAYPTFTGTLVDDAGTSEGWDVVDVRKDYGEVVSVYSFSLER